MPIDDLLDALLDLKHDLGKYLRLPLAGLASDASELDLQEAVRRALWETRRGPGGVRTARDLWSTFRDDVGDDLTPHSGWVVLCEAVERMLAWEAALEGGGRRIVRADVDRDFAEVTTAIQRLIADLRQGET